MEKQCFICRRNTEELDLYLGVVFDPDRENFKTLSFHKYEPEAYKKSQRESKGADLENEFTNIYICIVCHRIMRNIGPQLDKQTMFVYDANLSDFF